MYEQELATARKLTAFFKAVHESADVLMAAVAAQATLQDLKKEIEAAAGEREKAIRAMTSAQAQSRQIEQDLEVHKANFHKQFEALHDQYREEEQALRREQETLGKALQQAFEAHKGELEAEIRSLEEQKEKVATQLHAVKRELENARKRVLNIAAG